MPDLTTERLLLRALKAEEAQLLRDALTVPGCRFADGFPLPDTHDGLDLFLRHGDERFGFSLIVRRDDGLVIGEIGFVGLPIRGVVTIGYAIVPSARRNGYATEAIAAFSEWALDQPDVEVVRAQTLPDNEPSIRALLRVGFVEEPRRGKVRRFALTAG